jgi:hypothetical protein
VITSESPVTFPMPVGAMTRTSIPPTAASITSRCFPAQQGQTGFAIMSPRALPLNSDFLKTGSSDQVSPRHLVVNSILTVREGMLDCKKDPVSAATQLVASLPATINSLSQIPRGLRNFRYMLFLFICEPTFWWNCVASGGSSASCWS